MRGHHPDEEDKEDLMERGLNPQRSRESIEKRLLSDSAFDES